ncbi:DUF1127 domain-containing protein [Dongia deserti]|uniref:DUF1127 domain-containing protein n=1 Tax=Dongia deserti TaxID=2268030 RepID=UPI000E659267|nr:DUF1127 domain-containing protein [Dongia deserti]
MYRYNTSDKSGSYFVRPTRGKTDSGAVTRLFDQVFTWFERSRQRRHLGELDDRLLRDIGVSRAEVEHEVALPFWRADRG